MKNLFNLLGIYSGVGVASTCIAIASIFFASLVGLAACCQIGNSSCACGCDCCKNGACCDGKCCDQCTHKVCKACCCEACTCEGCDKCCRDCKCKTCENSCEACTCSNCNCHKDCKCDC